MVRVVVNKLFPDSIIPVKSFESDAGADIFSRIDAEIPAWSHLKIPTGISLEIPQGYEVQVRSRSGLASKHGIFVLNSPGTIDQDYRGEVCVILANFSDNPFKVSVKSKIAQLVLSPVVKVEYEVISRANAGFGSTDIINQESFSKSEFDIAKDNLRTILTEFGKIESRLPSDTESIKETAFRDFSKVALDGDYDSTETSDEPKDALPSHDSRSIWVSNDTDTGFYPGMLNL